MTNKDRAFSSKVAAVATSALMAILLSASLACVTILLRPLISSAWSFVFSHATRLNAPAYPWTYAGIIFVSALAIIALKTVTLKLAEKLWRSLLLDLIRIHYWIWVLSLFGCFLLLDLHHLYLAATSILTAGLLTLFLARILRGPEGREEPDYSMDPDLPIAEDGKDLLDRGEIINRLATIVLRERPSVIALIGAYGDGKTSLLNLTIGELRKLDEAQRPVIVKFSPWLPGNSTALIMSLLTSITSEIRRDYIMPGLRRVALQYGRVLMGVIPKVAAFKELFEDASQEKRIRELTGYIGKMPRRIVVVLDDLDRMHARELEVVFKILRGSEDLSTVTFICSFDLAELASILKSTRRFQDTTRFIEKFFQIKIAVPKIDSSKIKGLFTDHMLRLKARTIEEIL